MRRILGGILIASVVCLDAKETLKVLANQQDFTLGAAAGLTFFAVNQPYKDLLRQEYNTVVSEYQMKFGQLQPERGAYRWIASDSLVAFAEHNGMKVRGHCLVWHKEASFLATGTFTREEMLAILKEHIHEVVGRYRGKIPQWDVVNEAISNNPDSLYRDTFLFRTMGIDYIDSCFRWAREADPDVQLYYNEYWNEGLGPKSDKTFEFVKGLKERGVPIDGVGLQCHFRYDSLPSFADMDTNIKRLAGLGLQVAFTEVDYRIRPPATDSQLAIQKKDYQGTLEVCLANPNCRTFIIWGVADDYSSWIPSSYPGWGEALPFGKNFQPKPAYDGLWESLAARVPGVSIGKPPARKPAPAGHGYAPGLLYLGLWDLLGRREPVGGIIR
ncbi:MAG: endo-1,4-beta-xylanase [Fibrobacteria bacterium]